MSKVCFKAVARAGVLLLAGLIVGCATGKKAEQVMAPQYYGVWFGIGPSYWWDISAAGARLYLVSDEAEECERVPAAVIGPNRINIIPSSNGTVSVRLDGEVLVTTQASGVSRLQRGTRSSICRLPSGKYLPGAPFAAP